MDGYLLDEVLKVASSAQLCHNLHAITVFEAVYQLDDARVSL